MKNLLGLLVQGFVYFCVGTILAQSAGLVVLWQKGALSDDRVLHMWAALQGVDIGKKDADGDGKEKSEAAAVQPAYEEIVEKRALVSLDLNLRESAIDKSLGELRAIETKIKTERQRFDYLVDSFDKKITELTTSATEAAILETQRTIESLPPKQAKVQLLKLLDDKPSPGIENPTESVVAIVKAMPIERRRKILSEFKVENEEDKLSAILKEILRGAPDVPLLKEARADLQKVMPERK